MFLFALFVLASGVTIVQVVTNPLISLLGKPASASSRLTFAQAFNSLGTTVFPYVGSILILGGLTRIDPKLLSGPALNAYRTAETHTVVATYLGLAAALLAVAAVVWSKRHRLADDHDTSAKLFDTFDLLKRPRFAIGTACIFLYVGAEVAIGSLIVSYLTQANVLGERRLRRASSCPFIGVARSSGALPGQRCYGRCRRAGCWRSSPAARSPCC